MTARMRAFAVLVMLSVLAGCGPAPTATPLPPTATGAPPTAAPPPTPAPATPAPPPAGGGVLAYVAWDRASNRNDIYLLDAGGGAPRLLPNTTRAWAPNWSPDGSRIAYIVHRNDNDWSMCVVNADGDNLQRLTQGSLDHFPAWSPDGTQIAFSRNGNLWVMRVSAAPAATASDLRQLTADPKQYVSGPAWSPDGTQIAFASQAGNPHGTASYDDPKTGEIYLVNADGSNLRKLTGNQASDISPAWSPDGTRIAFVSDRDGSSQIYVMDAGGSHVQRLTDDHANDCCPAWSPDGARIAFCSDRDGKAGDYHFQIYVMNADGSGQTRLTDSQTTDMNPAWKPAAAAPPASPTPAVPAGATPTPATPGMVFDERRALEHVAYLASDDLEGRRPDTPGGQKAGDYIAARFAEYGLQPAGSDGTYYQPFTTPYTNIVESPVLIATFPNPDLSSGAILSRTYTYHTDYLPRIPGYLGSGDAAGQVMWLGACDPGDLDATLADKILLCRSPSANRYDELVEQSLNYEIGGLLLMREDEGPYVRPSYRIGELSALPAFQIPESIAQDLLAGTQYTLDDLDGLSVPVPLSATVHMAASFQVREIEARNVLGLLPGTDPQLKEDIVVIGAHYDHMGRDPDGTIYNGANDNASGVAVMLEIARLWQAQGFRPARSVLFAAWDDEEQGLFGSRYYVRHPVGSLSRTAAMLNLDMVGVGDEMHIGGRGVVATQLQASAKACHVTAIADPEAEAGGSDDTPFLDAGIPAGSILWTTDSALELAYHRPEDDTGNILPGNLKTAGILAAHAMTAWGSAGGGAIAFVSERKGNQDIFLMNADGSGQTSLTTSSSNEGWPSWSPDGTQIAFHAGYPSVIKILNLADGTTRQLPVDLGGNLWEPAWSHDGKRIAFAHASSATVSDIYVANPDGTGLQQLVGNGRINGGPVWSPDDRQIAFYSDRDGDFEVYVMDAGGDNQRRLTDSPGEDVATSWSPDGMRIAFQSKRDGSGEIYVINVDGSGLARLTGNKVDDLAPAWSPDGTMIAYDSGKGSERDIYVMNADGTGVRRLTDTPGKDYYPVWRPAPSSPKD